MKTFEKPLYVDSLAIHANIFFGADFFICCHFMSKKDIALMPGSVSLPLSSILKTFCKDYTKTLMSFAEFIAKDQKLPSQELRSQRPNKRENGKGKTLRGLKSQNTRE